MEPVEFPAHARPVGEAATAARPLLDWLGNLDPDRPQALAEYSGRLARAARDLVESGADGQAVTRMIADLDDVLLTSLLMRAEARLGQPPYPYSWLVLGSAGRREQALFSDQDNAIVFSDAGHGGRTVPGRHVATYFTALAEAAEAGLEAAGFPRCQGGCTATRWQHSLTDWSQIFRDWVERPEPRALVQAEVFLDFRLVHGSVSPHPLDDILRTGTGHPRFLVQMARAAVTFVPPLGLFRRIRTEGHEVDLKRAGIAAIVLLARLYALAAGSVVRPTPARLAAAVSGGMLSPGGGDRLAQHYRFLTDLRLRSQLRQISSGGRPDNRLALADLAPDDRRRLGEALRAVREIQQTTALRFQTHAVT